MLKLTFPVTAIVLALLCLGVVARGAHAQTAPVARIEAGTPVEGTISRGESRHFEVQAPGPGAYLHLEVQQRDAGLGMSLRPPGTADTVLARRAYEMPPETLELSWEATVAGAYRIEIRAYGPGSPKGSYRVTLHTAPTTGAKERLRISAEEMFAEGLRTRSKPAGAGAAESVGMFEKALAAWREAGDLKFEVKSLYALALAYEKLEQFDKCLAVMRRALERSRALGDKQQLAKLLYAVGVAHEEVSQFEEAVRYLNQALVLHRELRDLPSEERVLVHMAATYMVMSEPQKAQPHLERALTITREMKNRREEGLVLSVMAATSKNNYGRAIDYLEQALAIAREIKYRFFEAQTLTNMAGAYIDLGMYPKAIEHAQAALVLDREIRNRHSEGHSLNALGAAYLFSGEHEKARDTLEQAYAITRELKNRYSEAMLLNHLGQAYARLQQPEKARESYQRALVVARDIKTPYFEGEALQNLGALAFQQKQAAQARTYFEQALAVRRRIEDRFGEGATLSSLMTYWNAQSRRQLAVFFGKQAVNSFQEIRQGLQRRQKDEQQSFLRSKEDTYRRLADLLIGQGRLPEAEQVIRMLKEEEFFDYLRRDSESSPKAERATLTPEEAELEKRYREIADQLTVLGSERGALLAKVGRSADEEQRLAKLEGDLTVAGQMFQRFLDGLENELKTSGESQARVFQLRESQGMMEALGDLGKGTVALYTLVGSDRYRVILTTATVQKGFEFPIAAEELNRKILAFRHALQNPKLDPGPLARELFHILIGPLARDLQAAKAETLMWSLDGVLRYIPVGASHDGRRYVAERWRNVVFTPASQTRLKDSVSRNWTALGLGVTKSHGEKVPALPGVAEEMRGIIRDSAGGPGVLEGTVRLDEQFTRDTMLAGLRARPPVVHVASHFQFQPGNETDSALLLGDGKLLSLAQIKALPNVFSGVELLTLSACNTATAGSGATGKEVEGFAVLAQRQGAKAVVASLWPVADSSTKELMQEFYRLRQAKGLAKVEALRQAQLALLRGEVAAGGTAAGRQLIHDEPTVASPTPQPAYRHDAQKPYAHPYYWAPFILIGNWK
ncbi:MAG: CHAT domain-containing protein [Bryobacterales bacterium]|nr:CHAT domain-containing protein [Bryobacterales bacterium]